MKLHMRPSNPNSLQPLVSLGPGGTYQVDYVTNGRALTALHQGHTEHSDKSAEEAAPLRPLHGCFLDWLLGITRLRLPVTTPTNRSESVQIRLQSRTRGEDAPMESERSSLPGASLPSGAGQRGFTFTEQGRQTLTARNPEDICSILNNRMENTTRVLDTQTDSNLSPDSRRSNEPWNLANNAGTGEREGRRNTT